MIASLIKSKKETIAKLTVDVHSHLIPGLDDGSNSIEESLDILKCMQKLGYQKVITTPHIMSDQYANTHEAIKQGLKLLRSSAKEAGLNIEIDAAAEYYLDDAFLQYLKQGEMMRIADNYLLCETSYLSKPLAFDEMIFRATVAGYKVMLAHPERYQYITDLKKEYQELKQKGIFFQVNINSFSGCYGKEAQKKALFLMEAGMIDFLGTDIHRFKQTEVLAKFLQSDMVKKVFKKNKILNDII